MSGRRIPVSVLAILICGSSLTICDMASGQTPGPKAPIMPPLSQYEALPSPPLQTRGLSPATQQAVELALRDAAQGNKKAADAERVIEAAKRAADRGRDAARGTQARRRGPGILEISFDGRRCRYSGEIVRGRATGMGVMTCRDRTLAGAFRDNRPDGLIVEELPRTGYIGAYRNGMRDGLGGDYRAGEFDGYEGEYKSGARFGFGVERDKDGAYPGRYGFYVDPRDVRHRVNMELSGVQNFRTTHWAGTFGAYAGPRIACTLIKGALLEGSVLDGFGAKFDAKGRVIERGQYAVGILNGGGPPC
ncbi:MAG: hypothetical protein ABI963_03335 [Rhizomicrobium sp.]